MHVHVSPGVQWWSKESREIGFPSQGLRLSGLFEMSYFQISVGIGQLRIWLFVGWGWRWNFKRKGTK